MFSKSAEKIISGKKVKIYLLPAITKGIPIARRLLNIIAPAVGGTLDGLRHDDLVHGVPKTFTDMSLLVCQQLEKIEVNSIVFELLKEMEVDGKEVDLDEYFSANYGEMVEVLEFALRENFQSFFTGNAMKQRFQQVVGLVMSGQTEAESTEE